MEFFFFFPMIWDQGLYCKVIINVYVSFVRNRYSVVALSYEMSIKPAYVIVCVCIHLNLIVLCIASFLFGFELYLCYFHANTLVYSLSYLRHYYESIRYTHVTWPEFPLSMKSFFNKVYILIKNPKNIFYHNLLTILRTIGKKTLRNLYEQWQVWMTSFKIPLNIQRILNMKVF